MKTPYSPEVAEQIRAKDEQLQQLRRELLALKRDAAMPVQDYTLTRHDGTTQKLSEAFGDRDQLVLIHNMGFRCPYCTMWADGFNGLWRYVARRAGFVLVSNDDPEKQARGAQARGWTFPMLSAQGTTMFEDLGFRSTEPGDDETQYGADWPGVSTLRRNADGSLERVAADFFGPGDLYNSAWHFFDLLADAREDIEPTEGLSDQQV